MKKLFIIAISCLILSFVNKPHEVARVINYDWVDNLNDYSYFVAEDYINVLDSGVTGDGVTDDGPALNTLVDNVPSGATLFFPQATYLINTTVQIDQPINLISGYAVLKTTANTNIIYLLADSSHINNFIFKGTGKNSGSTSQWGIRISGGRNQVSACDFYDFGGSGIRAAFSSGATSTGMSIAQCGFYTNNIGIDMVNNGSGEYINVTGGIASQNNTGIKLGPGNTVITGMHLPYNSVAFDQVANVNDGHGVINGCTVNHSAIGYRSVGTVTSGMEIVATKFYATTIVLEDNIGIRFKNCAYRQVTTTLDNNIGCSFDDGLIDTQYPFVINWVGTNTVRFRKNDPMWGNIKDSITKSSNYTITEIDNDILADGTIDITLPTAYKKFDSEFMVTNIGSGTVTIVGTVIVDGVSTVNPTLAAGHFMRFYSDAIDYRCIGKTQTSSGGSGTGRVIIQ